MANLNRREFLVTAAVATGTAAGGRCWTRRTSARWPGHYQNFIDCVKTRRAEDLIAEIEEGHYSAMLCHLGNISYRTGRRLQFDPQNETFVDDAEANGYLSREYRRGFELAEI